MFSSSKAGRLRGTTSKIVATTPVPTTVSDETAAVYEELYLSYQAPDQGLYGDAVGVQAQAKPEELDISYQSPDEGLYGDAVDVQAQAQPEDLYISYQAPAEGLYWDAVGVQAQAKSKVIALA
jgi:hypothetical protein